MKKKLLTLSFFRLLTFSRWTRSRMPHLSALRARGELLEEICSPFATSLDIALSDMADARISRSFGRRPVGSWSPNSVTATI
jgi:hypothetical protein